MAWKSWGNKVVILTHTTELSDATESADRVCRDQRRHGRAVGKQGRMPPRHLVWVIASRRLVSAAAGPASIIHRSARFSVRLSAVSPSRPAISQGVACGLRQAWPKATAKRRAAGFTQAASNATLGQARKLTTTHTRPRRTILVQYDFRAAPGARRRPRQSSHSAPCHFVHIPNTFQAETPTGTA